MRFAKEGYVPAAIPAAIAVIVAIFGWYWVAAALLVAAGAALAFFRDPERNPDGGPDAIVSPADGRVVKVKVDGGGHKLSGEAVQTVSVFMSPLNVHINRMPTDGTIENIEFSKGQFRAAYSDDAPDVNESNAMLIRARGLPIVVVQIAGWLARRIVCKVNPGDALARAERFGLIMFGSRVDVHLPADVEITVQPGRRVKAGETVIAKFRSED